MDNLEPGADSEDFVGPRDSTAELIANARAGIDALEGRLKERVERHIDACLAVALAEAADSSAVLGEPDEKREARRKAAKWKAAKWKEDVERPSGILFLFKSCLLEVMSHIDALPDRAVQASLMVNLGFLLRASGSSADRFMESESNELMKALKLLNDTRPAQATKAKKTDSAQIDEIILNRASPHRTDDGGWERGTLKKIQPDVERDVNKINAERRAAHESLPDKKRQKRPVRLIPNLEPNTISRRLARLKRTIVRPS
jgi:hypothetical protein